MRFVLFVVFIFSFASAIEINIQPDKKIDISNADINALKRYLLRKFHFHISPEGAKKIVKENRVLANEYLKKGLLTPTEKERLKIELETRFADEFVEHMQRTIKIPEETLKSYYYDHIKDFKNSDQANLVRYRFKDYKNALAFYEAAKKNEDTIDRLLKKYGGKEMFKGEIHVEKLREPLRSFVKNSAPKSFIPPIALRADAVDVYLIRSYKKNPKYKPFKEVKDKIEDILYKQTFKKERDKIIEKYRKKGLISE